MTHLFSKNAINKLDVRTIHHREKVVSCANAISQAIEGQNIWDRL